MKKKTRASAWVFRLIALALVAATAAAGWLFWKGGYLGGDKPEPTAPVMQASDPTEPVANDPVTSEATQAPETETAAPETTEPEEPEERTVTILAVGDNLIHNMVYSSGYGFDPWNYDHLYQYVKDDIQAADIAVIDGARGMYDGLDSGSRCSAWSLSRHPGTPVVLVIDACIS